MNTNHNVQDQIIETLKMNPEDVPHQDSLPPEESPLNYPIAEKHFEEPSRQEEKAKEVDNGHAMMMAEVILGAANNIIEVGSGFFIKIRTDASFIEYEELIQVIEEQNQRNIKRMTLDEGDNAMLGPLLAEVLKARQKVLSPEHQLLIAGVSILIRKAQLVMEVRAENQILTERIRSIIQEEAQAKAEQPKPSPFSSESEMVMNDPRNSQDQIQPIEPKEIQSDQIGEKEESTPKTSDSDPSGYKLSRQDRRKAEREAKKNGRISSEKEDEQGENEHEPEQNES